MTSNVIMYSPDRELFGVKIRQQSKTGHLNLTDLVAAYEVGRVQLGWSQRNVYEVLGAANNVERLFYLLENQGSIKLEKSSFTESIEKQGVTKVLKSCGAWRTTGRSENKTTWCNPYVWTLLAMEMNPMLYAKTVVWLTDSLLLNRVEAGTMYKGLALSLSRLGYSKPDQFATVGRALNFVVFGRHENGLRQLATSEQLKELAGLEEKTAWAIDTGLICNSTQVLNQLRNVWKTKFNRGIQGR